MRARLGGVITLPALALLVLGSCGGSSDPLTTQEYSDRLVQAQAELEEKAAELQDENVKDFSEVIGANQEARRLLATAEWSDDDLERASDIAKTLLEAGTRINERSVRLLRPYGGEISGLVAPSHLADLHDTMVEALEDVVTANEAARRTLEDLDTDIENHEELRALLRQLGTTISLDDVVQAFNEACHDLKDMLEAELGKGVAICAA